MFSCMLQDQPYRNFPKEGTTVVQKAILMKQKQALRKKRKEREDQSYSLENYSKQTILVLTEVGFGMKGDDSCAKVESHVTN